MLRESCCILGMENQDEEECRTKLPLPEPTEAAVEAGLFGRCADGSLRPNEEEIRSIVEAQVVGLADLALRIESCQRAERAGRHPTSGKRSRKLETRETFQRAARQRAHEARLEFLGHLIAYEDALLPVSWRSLFTP